MDEDLDMLEGALTRFMKAMWRPKSWEAVQRAAKTTIDRPGASLLMALGTGDNGCKLSELASRIGVEAPSVTRTVQRLEQEQFIRRSNDPTDHRVTYIQLTRRGRATIKALQQAKRERLRSLLHGWPQEDRTQLIRLLHRLALRATEVAQAPHEKTESPTK